MESFLYTVQEAAEALKISRSKVYGLMKEGELPSVKIGGSRRLRKQDLMQYVDCLDVGLSSQISNSKGL
jgi:excisionase family DNA binding protein